MPTTPLWFSSTIRLPTQIPISPCTLKKPTFFMSEIPFGTATTLLSITRREELSTVRYGLRKQTWPRPTRRRSYWGHGAVGGKADLILFRHVLVEMRDKVAALKKQGRVWRKSSKLATAPSPSPPRQKSGLTRINVSVT